MTKIISDLLGTSEPLFSINLEQLERAAGRPNVDIRLTAEMVAKAQRKARELGLDPTDTTALELYHAMINLTQIGRASCRERV